MKLIKLCELCSVLDDVYNRIYDTKNHIIGSIVLTSGKVIKLDLSSDKAFIEVEIRDSFFLEFVRARKDYTLISTLWDEERLELCTQGRRLFHSIHIASISQLKMLAVTVPALSSDTSTSCDDLEALMFQLETLYTSRQVYSMVMHLVLDGKNTDEERYIKKVNPTFRINFNVFDELNEDDLNELCDILNGTRYARVGTEV